MYHAYEGVAVTDPSQDNNIIVVDASDSDDLAVIELSDDEESDLLQSDAVSIPSDETYETSLTTPSVGNVPGEGRAFTLLRGNLRPTLSGSPSSRGRGSDTACRCLNSAGHNHNTNDATTGLLETEGSVEEIELIDLTGHDEASPKYVHNIELDVLVQNYVRVHSCPFADVNLHVGDGVELEGDSDSLRIVEIWRLRNSSSYLVDPGDYLLRGILIGQASNMDDLLPKKRAEGCIKIRKYEDDPRSDFEQGLQLICADQVVQVRPIYFTNAPFPLFKTQHRHDDWSHGQRGSALVCRFKYVTHVSRHNGKEQMVQVDVAALSEREADPQYRVSDARLLLDHTRQVSGAQHLLRFVLGRIYTFADLFCGMGGVSQGAQQAGLRILFGLDHNRDAIRTWAQNFAPATAVKSSIFSFVQRGRFAQVCSHACVDILHVSCPCQFFAHSHTVEGQNDEKNVAANLCIIPVLDQIRPRLVTVEQTDGLKAIFKHRQLFHVFLHQFTAAKYSISWRIVNFAHHGMTHARKRLIVVAACPGQALPSFPPQTHGITPCGRTLRPIPTFNQATANIPLGTTEHNPAALRRAFATQYRYANLPPTATPLDGNAPLKHIIDCSGLRDLHPAGDRRVSVREQMRCQGLPDSFTFFHASTTSKLRQVGNLVFPGFAEVLFRECIGALRQADQGVRRFVQGRARREDGILIE